ncbi:nitroreductase family protein [Microbaculum sp. FT89]|uniref:nitroreductase family protein n=1 Tax=Microbaculum sp. FT89 TaxID=3447298 RepID=UPI003F52A042
MSERAVAQADHAADYDALIDVMRRRRSVRRFEKGHRIDRDTLMRIAEAARWAPTGANTQCFDVLIVDDPDMRDKVLEVFLRQSNRLIAHVKGFPAVKKTYLANTVAIVVVLGDPRWKASFPNATDSDWEDEYHANNENILLASIGAAIQNVQLAVTACGLTSAWLSGGGEATTNRELSELLGYPDPLIAYGTIPIGYPEKDVSLRWRRPVEQIVHWNGYEKDKFRPQELVDFYVEKLRPFAMYRGVEDMRDWEDFEEKAGEWADALTGPTIGSRSEDR